MKGVRIVLNPSKQIIRELGLDTSGHAQAFHTQNVLRRIVKFMPRCTGDTIKLAIAQTDIQKPYIVLDVPYGKYLYYGKAMEGPAPKTVTKRDLHYTTAKNADAGPFWDRRLSAAEGPVLVRELQNYVNRRK